MGAKEKMGGWKRLSHAQGWGTTSLEVISMLNSWSFNYAGVQIVSTSLKGGTKSVILSREGHKRFLTSNFPIL